MRYVFNRFGEALELLAHPERYVRLDADLAEALGEIVQENGSNGQTAPRPTAIAGRMAIRQLALDILRFGMRYQWTSHENALAWEQLTPREQQVAALVCLGYTNHEIAHRLVISTSTVKSHVRNILQKFRLNGKLELKGVLRDWDFSAWDDPDRLEDPEVDRPGIWD